METSYPQVIPQNWCRTIHTHLPKFSKFEGEKLPYLRHIKMKIKKCHLHDKKSLRWRMNRPEKQGEKSFHCYTCGRDCRLVHKNDVTYLQNWTESRGIREQWTILDKKGHGESRDRKRGWAGFWFDNGVILNQLGHGGPRDRMRGWTVGLLCRQQNGRAITNAEENM